MGEASADDRARWLVQACVELASPGDADVAALLVERCGQLVPATDVSVAVVGEDGELEVAACSSERMVAVAACDVRSRRGPSPDCVRTGRPLLNVALDGPARWPRYTPLARAAGYGRVHVLPLRVGDRVTGALCVCGAADHRLPDGEAELVQALADVAAATLALRARLAAATELADQLQTALRSRVVIEQAKGVVAERLGLKVDEAFELMRGYARRHGARLAAVAADLVAKVLPATALSLRSDGERLAGRASRGGGR
ncbi:MAG TPA: GAF and ANTAR domain-containing protein [Acidimicrobiales bacterium]